MISPREECTSEEVLYKVCTLGYSNVYRRERWGGDIKGKWEGATGEAEKEPRKKDVMEAR